MRSEEHGEIKNGKWKIDPQSSTVRVPSLGQHREGGSILLGSIGSTPGIELLSPIPAPQSLIPNK